MPYVAPVYPATIPSTSDLPDKADDIDYYNAIDLNNIKKELRAALIELGTNPKGAYADVAAALAAALKIASPASGDVVYFNGTTWVSLPKGTDGQVLTLASGVPTWAAGGGGGSIPSGLIALWHGLLSAIPSGWVLCNGNNGTPNLLSKFIRSVPSGTDPGATGGNDSITLAEANMPAHTHTISEQAAHTHTISDSGTHTHAIPLGADLEQGDVACGSVNEYGSDTSGAGGNHSHGGATGSGNAHSHGGATGSKGSGTAFDNRPAYYELAFIMKT
jgi:microcystin-dependent protein